MTPDMLHAGKGSRDWLTLESVDFHVPRFSAEATGFDVLEVLGSVRGDDGDNKWDLSGFDVVDGEAFIVGMGGDDVMIGANGHFNRFYGLAGNDRLYGGNDMDEMSGGTGRNKLYGGGGDDNMLNIDFVSDGPGRTLMDGGDGNDLLFANNGRYRVFGGNGADEIGFEDTVIRQDTIFGGNGIDLLLLRWENAVFDVDLFDAESTGIESLEGGEVIGSKRANTLDFSEFTVIGDAGVMIDGRGGNDVLTGTYRDDTILGGEGNDALNGTAGNDTFDGGKGDDRAEGDLGADTLAGGKGADVFAYAGVTDSTGTTFDTIEDFNRREGDTIDLWFTVVAIATLVEGGTLSEGSIDADLVAAVGAAQLGAHEALLFGPDAGSLAGAMFLVVDANADPGYQAGVDLVIRISGHGLGGIDVDDFT